MNINRQMTVKKFVELAPKMPQDAILVRSGPDHTYVAPHNMHDGTAIYDPEYGLFEDHGEELEEGQTRVRVLVIQ